MENSLVYERLAQKKVRTLELLKGGFSNKTYLVNGEDALRVKERSDPDFYNPKNECAILRALASSGLLAPLTAFDETKGDMVTRFVPSDPFLGPTVSKEDIKKVLRSMDIIHATKGSFAPFDLWGRYDRYRELSGAEPFPQEDLLRSHVMRAFAGEQMVLCHNDLVRGNVLKKADGSLLLLDFEFAGLNYPEFDLASLFSENNLPPELIECFIGTNEKIRLLIKVANRLWYFWACHRAKETGEEIFQRIAADKMAAIQAEKI